MFHVDAPHLHGIHTGWALACLCIRENPKFPHIASNEYESPAHKTAAHTIYTLQRHSRQLTPISQSVCSMWHLGAVAAAYVTEPQQALDSRAVPGRRGYSHTHTGTRIMIVISVAPHTTPRHAGVTPDPTLVDPTRGH